MNKFTKLYRIVVVLLMALLLTGCYWNTKVQPEQAGIRLKKGKIEEVAGPGMYSGGMYTDIVIVNVSAQTITWNDPDLVTRDKQPIGLDIGVTYARNRTDESLASMWRQYNREARNDEALAQQVLNRVPRVAKAVTTQYTLDEMLGISGEAGREIVTQALFDLLEPELAEFGIVLLDVGINNIAPDPEYLALLKQKANAQVAVEVAQQEAKKLIEQLEQEKAQTEIELERARRENEVNAELSKTYAQSPEYFELEKLRLLANVFGQRDKIVFLPEGADITLFMGGGGIVPIEP